jgi:hypothetical protein
MMDLEKSYKEIQVDFLLVDDFVFLGAINDSISIKILYNRRFKLGLITYDYPGRNDGASLLPRHNRRVLFLLISKISIYFKEFFINKENNLQEWHNISLPFDNSHS